MAKIENKAESAASRLWRWTYIAALAVHVAVISPPMLAFLAVFFVGGGVVRWLWTLRA